MQVLDVLQSATISGTTVILPEGQLDRKVYQEVAKKLEGIGGKWNKKVGGFSFAHDPSDLLAEVAGGANRNLKKEFQFFPTPDDIADYLVELADVRSGLEILEPSAGQGAIVKAIRREVEFAMVDCFELMPQNRSILQAVDGTYVRCDDFLQSSPKPYYDRILANPPFSKNQDIDHIRHMYQWLAEDGILVSVASKHWQLSNNAKETAFRAWLDDINADIIDIPAGAFKDSGTMVSSCIIKIQK